MLPNHQEITEIEEALASDAMPLGGRSDGWGCFAPFAAPLNLGNWASVGF